MKERGRYLLEDISFTIFSSFIIFVAVATVNIYTFQICGKGGALFPAEKTYLRMDCAI